MLYVKYFGCLNIHFQTLFHPDIKLCLQKMHIFSFLIKTAKALNSINGKPLIKSQKYLNIDSTNHKAYLNNNYLKHNSSNEKACLYKSKNLDENFIYENNYKNELLYDV